MAAFAILILVLLIAAIAITTLIASSPRGRTQARQAQRLFTVLRDDAIARLEDEREHQATLKALHETREQVATGTYRPAISGPGSRPQLRRRRSSGFLFGVLLLALGLSGGALALAAHSSPTRPPEQPTTQALSPPIAANPDATPMAAPQPDTIRLGISDFTAACQARYGDASAVAKIAPTSGEPPSYWVKCFDADQMLGGLDLDAYCPSVAPGTRSDNPKRYDYTATNDGWLYWECVPA